METEKQTNIDVCQAEKKEPELVKNLADAIYNSILEACEEQNLDINDFEVLDKVFWALTKAHLRFRSRDEKRDARMVELLVYKIYNSIVKNGEEQGLILGNSEFTNQVCWALTIVELRFHSEIKEPEQKEEILIA